MKRSRLNFIDLFSGAGGFLEGFCKAGFIPLFAVENWDPAIQTHILNHPDIHIIKKDISRISRKEIKKLIRNIDVDVIIGGPPCQGFSTIGKRLLKDPRNKLILEFMRIIRVVQPKVFLMENVRGLQSYNYGKSIEFILKGFKRAGYKNLTMKVLCSADYGVPQMRHRLFIMGIRNDINLDIDFPAPTLNKGNYKTAGEAIMDLVGKECQMPNHIPMKHNIIVEGRIGLIPEGKGLPTNGLPRKLLFGSRRDFANIKIKNFSHIYRRLHRNKPSTTMVPGHNAFPLHPTENRALTVREAARIQTFDDSFIFAGTRQEQCIQVGNAVPVNLARILALNIRKSLLSRKEKHDSR